PIDPGSPGQRVAAHIRAPRLARRRGPARVALPHGRHGIRGGPGVGKVHREQTRGGIRAPVTGKALLTRLTALQAHAEAAASRWLGVCCHPLTGCSLKALIPLNINSLMMKE